MSLRTFERLLRSGQGPRCEYVRRPGMRPEPRYNPEDVARLAALNAAPTLELYAAAPDPDDREPSAATTTALATTRELSAAAPLFGALAKLLEQRSPAPPAPVPAPRRPWLTLEEVVEDQGLTPGLVRRFVREDLLHPIGRPWRFHRSELDALAEAVLHGARRPKKKAVRRG